MIVNLRDISGCYLCRYFMNRDLHERIFLLAIFFTFLFCFLVLFLGFPLCVNCALCPRIYLHDSRNLSGAKNISQVRAAAAEIDCSPEPQVAKWAARQSSQAEQQQQPQPQQSCPSVRLWFGYPSPSLALLSLSLPVILSLCFFLCLFPCAYSATVSLANCTKSLHCFADTLCACLRVERKWNACVECKQRTKSNKLQRKLLNNSSQICTVGVQMCCGRLCLYLSASIPCKRRKG